MWTKFDQSLNDELQPLWVAVLLWGDVQIRLSVIRPTFPVKAFEAPGALGCEKPVDIIRRSDQKAGWEYAEAEGRAIAIQRLVGYECQQASAPFLDQSNINLAYSYSEQPVIYESQAAVAARCLAAASLVRPTPFDPAKEFAGIRVEVESPELFRVSLPDGRSALVAPGETMPKRAVVSGMQVEGPAIRYVQASKDLDDIAGLGLTAISGIVAFDEAATFRLRRFLRSKIHLTTNTGLSLNDEWLDKSASTIEVLTLDNQWQDISAQCPRSSIPRQVVQEWSDRNQRTLVEFRITHE